MSDLTNNSSPSQSQISQTSHLTTSEKPASRPIHEAKKAVCSNWKTTIIGLTLSFTGFVAFSPSTFGGEQAPLVQLCKYITSGGMAALGIYSKDFNVSGGNKDE